MPEEIQEIINLAKIYVSEYPNYPRSREEELSQRAYNLTKKANKKGHSSNKILKILRQQPETCSSKFIIAMRYGKKWRTFRNVCFRRDIKRRDGYQCKICLSRPKQLDIHHIGSPTNHNPKNLITVCKSCHKHFAEQSKKIDKRLSKLILQKLIN